jgi:ubiquinone/menaquinone biosynthesis C-methylase UbiE
MESCNLRSLRDAWNLDYRMRGALYGGAPLPLPDLPPGALVLDLGCGNGKHLPVMKAKGWRIIGIDIAEEAIWICRGTADLIVGDGCTLPFKDHTFHAVIGIHILGHLTKMARPDLIHEVERIVRKDGTFYCTVFSTGDMRCGSGEEVEPFTYRRRGIITHYFTEEELSQLQGPFKNLTLKRDLHQVRFSGVWHTREQFICTFRR